MPQFSHDPPTLGDTQRFELVRTPPNGRLQAIITSTRLIGCPTHFYRGRTLPCEGDPCPACSEGLPWRWHGYFAAWDPKTGQHYILELTAPPAESVAEYYESNGTIRGALFVAQRASDKPNGRVSIKLRPADTKTLKMPQAPDITAILCNMWNIAQARTETTRQTKNHSRLDIAAEEIGAIPGTATGNGQK